MYQKNATDFAASCLADLNLSFCLFFLPPFVVFFIIFFYLTCEMPTWSGVRNNRVLTRQTDDQRLTYFIFTLTEINKV